MKKEDLELIIDYFRTDVQYNLDNFQDVIRWRNELFQLIMALALMPSGVRRAVLSAFETELAGIK